LLFSATTIKKATKNIEYKKTGFAAFGRLKVDAPVILGHLIEEGTLKNVPSRLDFFFIKFI
jgi:hypothetical protein